MELSRLVLEIVRDLWSFTLLFVEKSPYEMIQSRHVCVNFRLPSVSISESFRPFRLIVGLLPNDTSIVSKFSLSYLYRLFVIIHPGLFLCTYLSILYLSPCCLEENDNIGIINPYTTEQQQHSCRA